MTPLIRRCAPPSPEGEGGPLIRPSGTFPRGGRRERGMRIATSASPPRNDGEEEEGCFDAPVCALARNDKYRQIAGASG